MRVAFSYYPLNIRWNHGSAVLSALCRKAGIETEIVPLQPGFTGEGFDWVCCSFVTVHDYLASRSIVDGLRVPKIAGGVYARKGGDIQGFERVCRGEGEKIVDFLLCGDTELFDSQLIDECIDGLADYSGVTGYEFGRGVPCIAGKKLIPYSHSRGCPYKCSFCEMRNLPQTVRIKTNIRNDLAYLKETHKPEMWYFTDETLPYYLEDWRCQIEGNDIPFLSFIRADIKPEELEFLIYNGLHTCAIGIESGDETYRNEVLNKGVTDKQIYETVATLDHYGINRIMLYMRNTPQETVEMQYKTFDMVDRLGGYPMIFEYEVL